VETFFPRSPGTSPTTPCPGAARPYSRVKLKLLPYFVNHHIFPPVQGRRQLPELLALHFVALGVLKAFFARQVQLLQRPAQRRETRRDLPFCGQRSL
jgi:hypothetical protein